MSAAAASSGSVNTAFNNVNAKGAVFAGNFEGNIDASVSNQTVIHNHEAILKLYKERESGELDPENCTVETILKNTAGSHTMAVGTYHNTSCIFKMFNGIDDDSLLKEAKRMKKLSSQNANICPCFGIVKFPSDYQKNPEVAGKTFSVLEKQPYSLDVVLKSKNLTDLTRYTIILGLLRALAFMSQSHPPVVHGDLANTQVLVSAAHQAVLIDLNASVELKSMLTQSIISTNKVGLYQWKAPELFEGEGKSRASDVYAFALLLFTICRCDAISSVDGEVKQPWGELNISEVSDFVLKGRRPATLEQLIEKHKIPAIISHIIVSAWSQNPSDRLGGAGVAGIRNLFDTHGEAVLQLPQEKFPGWLKFSSSPSSSPTKSDKYSYLNEIEELDEDCKSILKKNKFTCDFMLDEETTKQDFVDIGLVLPDVKQIMKWIPKKKIQIKEAEKEAEKYAKEEAEQKTILEATTKLLQQAAPLFTTSKYSEALALYSKVIDSISLNEADSGLKQILSRALSNRSGCFLGLKKFKEALEDARRCAVIRPSWIRSHLRVAAAAEELEEFDVAVSAYESAMKAADRSGKVPSQEEIEKSIVSVQRKQFNSAASSSKTTTTLTAEETQKILQEAAPLLTTKKYSEAVSLYSKIINGISLNEADSGLKQILSRALSNRSGCFLGLKKFKEALEDARRCAVIRPSWIRSHLRVAAAAEELHEYDVAIAAYQSAIKAEDRSGNVPSQEEIEKSIVSAQRNQSIDTFFGTSKKKTAKLEYSSEQQSDHSDDESDKYLYLNEIEDIDEDSKSILKKNKFTCDFVLDEKRTKQDFLDIGLVLPDVKKIMKWIPKKKIQIKETVDGACKSQ